MENEDLHQKWFDALAGGSGCVHLEVTCHVWHLQKEMFSKTSLCSFNAFKTNLAEVSHLGDHCQMFTAAKSCNVAFARTGVHTVMAKSLCILPLQR